MKQACLAASLALAITGTAAAQPGPPPGMPPQDPRPASPEVGADGSITIRAYAPNAKAVTVTGEFIPWGGAPLALTKDDKGIWSGATKPVAPGTYRYGLRIDDAPALDMSNLEVSGSRTKLQNVVVSPGPAVALEANRPDVPHGAVAVVWYPSKFGGGQRRMHVYTPPGYDRGKGTYPVLYLIHGGGDSDDGWWTVGRAGFIMDNLIAAGKAKPMIVVMPDGNAGPKGQVMTGDPALEPFNEDLMQGIIPFVERSYRASARPADRALAGLSMGGIQTLNIGFSNLDSFQSLGVFSSGFFPPDQAVFEAKLKPALTAAPGKLKVFYEAYGETDIARVQAENNIKLFATYGLKPVVEVTPGGHEWANWRRYLASFAPMLFR